MPGKLLLVLALAGAAMAQPAAAPAKLQVLIVTGRDTHDWRGVTPLLRQYLEDTQRFDARIAEEFRDAGPESLAGYDAAVLVYCERTPEERWTPRARQALLDFVQSGKGLVICHHSTSAFKDWPEYARLCGGNYTDKNGQHSPLHDFTVKFVDREHPITRGLKAEFVQPHDELYSNMLMQPPGAYHVLATAWDDHSLYKRMKQPLPGQGRDEPVMWTVPAGKGRVFATMIGHGADNTRSTGFRVTFARGVEWAATGAVTLAPPPELAQ